MGLFLPVNPKLEDNSIADETLLEQLRALPRVVWILFAGLFIHRFGTFVVPFLTLYLKDQGYSAWDTAIVFASMAVGGIGAMVLGGRLSDLIGRKNTMGLALFGAALSMLLMW
ncbi:MAG: MFS transporter [Verrucomicrobiales bacterium]